MIGSKLKYYKWNDKVYKVVDKNGFYQVEEYDEKHHMFSPAPMAVRAFDIQALGVEMNPEEILRLIR